jgi:flagellar biosynthesis/type III secretory pathway protein FliH
VKSLSAERIARLGRVALTRAPRAVRLVPAGLDELARDLAEAEREVLREEGRRSAAHDAAGALARAVERLETARGEALEQLTGDTVRLAVEIARALLHVELDAGRYDLGSIVRDALSASGVRRGESVVVHVCPVDLARLADVAFRADTRLVADGELGRGEVHVTTPHGVLVRDIDIALDGVLERLRAEIA